MKENKDEITRGEAIKKMGRYAGFAALGTFMILNPQKGTGTINTIRSWRMGRVLRR